MKTLKYLFEFIIIFTLFFIFKIIGYRLAIRLSSLVLLSFGPFFRSKKRIITSIKDSLKETDEQVAKKIVNEMWSNYGKILAEYVFIKKFRKSKFNEFINIEGSEILEEIKNKKEPVIFVSGHFNNFELMAMEIEKSGVNLAAIYRPLNNIFLNKIMESIRTKYICKNQIKKGRAGTRELLRFFKDGYSIALMIDQRVSEGIKSNFYGRSAFTTTIPAQLIKKFKCKIVPVYIERLQNTKFKIMINKPLVFDENQPIEEITQHLNYWLEEMISKNPGQWIWSHNRWK
jgi:Kdo2-lipid IVA lauroyltransferase/acyltransferase